MTIHRFSRIGLSVPLLGMLCAACGGGSTGTTGSGGAAASSGSETTSSASASGGGGAGSTTTSATTTTGTTSGGTGGAAAMCGDGKQDPGEDCDDGAKNADTGDCTTACKKAACGDGFKQMGEDCDEGAKNADTGTCTTKCKAPACGDGFIQAGEECDMAGQNSDTGACTSMCKNAKCGDGLVAPTEGCDLGAQNSDTGACTSMCKSASCGDAFVQSMVEQCDLGMGNNVDTGACTTMCKNATCGDGFVRAGVEECDMGMANADTGACTSTCKAAKCGDGFVQAGTEECDLGGANANTGACTLACKSAKCGDGFKQGTEACDDGNMVSGDGCNTDCVVSGTQLTSITDANAAVWYAAAKDPSGNVIVAGAITGPGAQGQNGVIQKYSAAGVVLWTQQYSGVANLTDSANGVTADAQGNIIAIGTETLANNTTDVWVRKYDAAGATIWTQTYNANAGAALNDGGNAITATATGDLFIGGQVTPTGSTNLDIFVARISGANGIVLGGDIVAGTAAATDGVYGITVTSTGNVVATGNIRNGATSDIWTRQYNPTPTAGGTLTPIWTQIVNGNGNGDDFGNAVAADTAGNVIVVGSATNAGQSLDPWLRKYDGVGNTTWTATGTSNTTLIDEATAVTIDASGAVIAGGYITQANMKLDSWVQKYSAAGIPVAAPSWPRTHNGPGNGDDIVNGLVTDATGNIYGAGAETNVTNALKGWLVKYAP
jgi:cysteine-rich repeat protein